MNLFKRKKWFFDCLIAIGTLTVFLIAWWLNISSLNSRVENLNNEMHRAGIALTIEELENQYHCSEKNAADVYQQIFDFLDTIYDDENGVANELPWEDIAPADDESLKWQHLSYLAEFQEIIQHLKQASQYEYCYLPIEYDNKRCPNNENSLGAIRVLFKMLPHSIVWSARLGNQDEMKAGIKAIFALSRHAKNQPFLLSHIMGNGAARYGINAIKIVLSENRLDSDLLQEIKELLDQVYDSDSLYRSLKSEITYYHYMNTEMPEMAFYLTNPKKTSSWTLTLYRALGGPQKYYLNTGYMALDYLEAVRQPWLQRRQNIQMLNIKYSESRDLFEDVISHFDLFGTYYIKQMFNHDLKTLTLNDLCDTALAIELYHNKYHAYPMMLTTLKPEFISEIPVDYFTPDNQFIRYDLTKTGYKLYSVSSNGKSDGGDESQDNDGYEMDIVFEVRNSNSMNLKFNELSSADCANKRRN